MWLTALVIVSSIIYTLRLIDSEEAQGKSKGYVIRRSIIGCLGSAIITPCSFLAAVHGLGFEPPVGLAIAGGISYLGADTASRLFEQLIKRYFKLGDVK